MTRAAKRGLWGASALLVLTGLAVAGWQVSKSRRFQFFGGLVTRVPVADSLVALTFDDGPTPAGTAAVLPLLDSLGVRATFFVTGRELAQHPEDGRRIVAAGHALGNHSYTHRTLVLHAPAFMRREIDATDALIRQAGWRGPILFRPPYGKRLLVLPYLLRQRHRPTLLWDVEPESYAEVDGDAAKIADHVVARVRPGSIVLLHVMYASREASRAALPAIITRLRAQGYRFVTVPELLAAPRG